MEAIVIVSAARTAVGKFGGSLAKVAAPELGATVIREAIARARLAKPSWDLAFPTKCLPSPSTRCAAPA